jgi:hypothetical protein
MATETRAPTTEPTQDIEAILGGTREQLAAAMEELRPAHDEFLKLERIVANYDLIASGEPIRGRRTSGDRANRGTRPQEFLALVKASGDKGITVAEASDQMEGMNPNYLYRLAKDMVTDGQIRKVEKRYFTV